MAKNSCQALLQKDSQIAATAESLVQEDILIIYRQMAESFERDEIGRRRLQCQSPGGVSEVMYPGGLVVAIPAEPVHVLHDGVGQLEGLPVRLAAPLLVRQHHQPALDVVELARLRLEVSSLARFAAENSERQYLFLNFTKKTKNLRQRLWKKEDQ